VRTEDGFIVGIYNYCDRWCDTCPFTSRCRVFTDMAEGEAAIDPAMHEIAAPLWMTKLVEGINAAAMGALTPEDVPRFRPRAIAPEYQGIRHRADAYCDDAHVWLQRRGLDAGKDPADPITVIRWLYTVIPPKVVRALKGLANLTADERQWPADPDGSAKVALIAIDRSHSALRQMVERRQVPDAEVRHLIAHLVWLGSALEQVFPRARAFVRPAFDEPDEIARVAASLQ
jgi:hypothetical protein